MLNLKKHLLIGVAAASIGLTAMSSFAQMPPADLIKALRVFFAQSLLVFK